AAGRRQAGAGGQMLGGAGDQVADVQVAAAAARAGRNRSVAGRRRGQRAGGRRARGEDRLAGRRRDADAVVGAEAARLVGVVEADLDVDVGELLLAFARRHVAAERGDGERLVGEHRVLHLEQELTEALLRVRGADDRLPGRRAAVLDGDAVLRRGAAREVLAGLRVEAAELLAVLVVQPLGALRLDHQAGVEARLLVRRGAEVVVGKHGAQRAVVERIALRLRAAVVEVLRRAAGDVVVRAEAGARLADRLRRVAAVRAVEEGAVGQVVGAEAGVVEQRIGVPALDRRLRADPGLVRPRS